MPEEEAVCHLFVALASGPYSLSLSLFALSQLPVGPSQVRDTRVLVFGQAFPRQYTRISGWLPRSSKSPFLGDRSQSYFCCHPGRPWPEPEGVLGRVCVP